MRYTWPRLRWLACQHGAMTQEPPTKVITVSSNPAHGNLHLQLHIQRSTRNQDGHGIPEATVLFPSTPLA